jgi:hypothetical protein
MRLRYVMRLSESDVKALRDATAARDAMAVRDSKALPSATSRAL